MVKLEEKRVLLVKIITIIITTVLILSTTSRSQVMSDFHCPRNLTEVLLASAKLGCGKDKYDNIQYLCLPNVEKTALIQLCHNEIMGIIEKGNCLETNEGKVFRRSCSGFEWGCPDNAFSSKDIYKFPACQEINKEFHCYLAEPSCPSPNLKISTSEVPTMELSTSVEIYNTTYINNQSLTTQETVSDSNSAIVWVTASIFIGVLILLTIWLIRRKLGNRKIMRQQDNNVIKDDETELLKNEEETFGTHTDSDNKETEKRRLDESVVSMKERTTFHKPVQIRMDSTESEDFLKKVVSDYSDWKTDVSDSFSTMGCDQLYVLFCFLCSEAGPPDFTKPEWVTVLNEIRRMALSPLDPIEKDNAIQTLEYLQRTEPQLFENDFQNITQDAADETVYRIATECRLLTVYLCNCHTSRRYLRLNGYIREFGEKCVINKSPFFDFLLILRMEMDILVQESFNGENISNPILLPQILHIPKNIIRESKDNREEFVRNLQQSGEAIYENSQHVRWHREYHRHVTVRSCIGLHPHSDIYIINHLAYRKRSSFHCYSKIVRCSMYSLLFAKENKLKINDDSYKSVFIKIRNHFFPSLTEDNFFDLPNEIAKNHNSGEVTFASADIRHEVMYAFVTECLIEDAHLEFFLKEAPENVIFEYCRSWNYKKKDGERCLYVPVDMNAILIKRLNLNIMKHCTMSDWNICNSISEILGVPLEILNWDQKARERYIEYAKKGTQEVHHSRGMLVGCAGAGKTTLLKRLLKRSEDEILNVTTTEGLEVHEEIFEISDESLKETVKKTDTESINTCIEGTLNAIRLSVFDFGGQSVYYACHQIYLTRRAFYVVVVDASNELNQKVGETVCKQDDQSVFAGWTYGDYFLFWIKSIHTYCGMEKEGGKKPIVLIVATHWEEEKRKFKDKEDFLHSLLECLPRESDLAQYIVKRNCYCIQFPIHPINELEKRIATIACQERWKEKIPKEWAFFGVELNQKKYAKRVLNIWSIQAIPDDASTEEEEENGSKMKQDMLQFYHDAGKILYFNENQLKKYVILDVQWFIDAFKIIITDNLNFEGIKANTKDFNEFYRTGHLWDTLLLAIWEHKDQLLCEELHVGKNRDQSTSLSNDSRFITAHKELLLLYMQRLGLVAVGKESHYIPCMNRKEVNEDILQFIKESESKTSILIYKFDFLPYFFFFRLVVGCMQEEKWKVLPLKEIPCLYKNAALFYEGDYNIILSVTKDSIQLQVFHAVAGCSLEIDKTCGIQKTIEDKLETITQTFHQRVQYKKGIRCKEDDQNKVPAEIYGYFLCKKAATDKESRMCPLHRLTDKHEINTEELAKYWKLDNRQM